MQRYQGRCVARNPGLLPWGKFVPRAYELAVVAAVDAVAYRLAKFFRDTALVFDGEVADAAARIQPVRRGDGAGRAHVDAGGATAAVTALRGRLG